MHRTLKTALLAGTLLAGVTGQSLAQDTELEQMRAEMAQMRAEMAQLRAQHQEQWLSDVRRAEVESLIADVFADAEKRASLLDQGAMAGIDEKGKIFLKSGDGTFSAEFSGQIQFRYLWNAMDTDNASAPPARASDSLSGFQSRRMKFGIKGKFGEGWGYKLVFATSRGTGPGGGNAFTEDVYITRKLGDSGFSLLAGTNKLPFARQEIISSTRQVAVDRSLATEFFTLNRSDQVTLNYQDDDIHANLALSDGGNADFTGFAADASNDFAVTGRVEWQAIGDDWGQAKSEFAGVDEDALFIAAAVHYEQAQGGGAPPVADSGVAWTVDALYKTGSFSLSTAVFGNHTTNSGAADTDQYAFYIQPNYKIGDSGWDVFGRWEIIDDDGVSAAGSDELQAITVGVNHHFTSRVKFTADVIWIYAGDNPSADGNFINGGELSSGLGLNSAGMTAADDHSDQVAFRAQLQLLF